MAKNVIYLVVDALRPDYLGCYGNSSMLTTEIDRLAEEGVLFEDVVSSAPWTVPSVATHLTGGYAHKLGIFSSEFDVKNEPIETVFDRFNREGYTTAAYLDSEELFHQWDGSVDHYAKSLELLDFLTFISEHADEPFFIFNLYRGTHLPYVLKYSREAWYSAQEEALDRLRYGGEEGVEESKYRYARAIEHFSEWYLRAILDRLETEGILEDTAIVLTADHGECWGERLEDRTDMDAFDLHGPHLYDEVLKIPLLMYNFGPSNGERVSEMVRSVDILPTMIEAVDISIDPEDRTIDGISLEPYLSGDRGESDFTRVAFSATTSYENPENSDISVISKFSVTREGWKLIWEPDADEVELYDLNADPDEVVDRSTERCDRTEELLVLLREEMECAGMHLSESDPDVVRQRLEDLGYL